MREGIKIFCPQDMGSDLTFWEKITKRLNQIGYVVYDEVEDCEIALIINASFTNPQVFKRQVFFGLVTYGIGDKPQSPQDRWINEIYRNILSEYCEHFVDLSHMTIEQATDKIIFYAEHL